MSAPSACDVCKGPGNPIGSWPGSIYLDGVQSQCQECYDAEERQADPAYLLTLKKDNRQPIYYPAFPYRWASQTASQPASLSIDMMPPPEPSMGHIGLPMCRHVYPTPICDAYIAGKAKGKGKANVKGKGKGKEVECAEIASHVHNAKNLLAASRTINDPGLRDDMSKAFEEAKEQAQRTGRSRSPWSPALRCDAGLHRSASSFSPWSP